jgi:hypothetical protein
MEKLNELMVAIEANTVQLRIDNDKFAKGNNAAGTRARKLAMQLTRDCKTYRAEVTEVKNA